MLAMLNVWLIIAQSYLICSSCLSVTSLHEIPRTPYNYIWLNIRQHYKTNTYYFWRKWFSKKLMVYIVWHWNWNYYVGNLCEKGNKQSLLHIRFLLGLFFNPEWRWRWHVPQQRRLTFNGLQGVISHTTELFTNTAVWTSNLPFSSRVPSASSSGGFTNWAYSTQSVQSSFLWSI
jgi:hypothetical protein